MTLSWREVLPFTVGVGVVVPISAFAYPITRTNWSRVIWVGHVIMILARGWLLVFTPNYTQQVITKTTPQFHTDGSCWFYWILTGWNQSRNSNLVNNIVSWTDIAKMAGISSVNSKWLVSRKVYRIRIRLFTALMNELLV